ncbi:MAG: response regulator [Myxococcales bacterium]|nr:response regulator [Myxococcales bacterium]
MTRILVVDDDDAIREELADSLGTERSLEISVANDGRTALQQIATGAFWPDVILLDLMMPGLDGHDFLAALDAINRTQQIAVIVMTALPESRIPENVRLRARSILSKPFSLVALEDSIRAVVKI